MDLLQWRTSYQKAPWWAGSMVPLYLRFFVTQASWGNELGTWHPRRGGRLQSMRWQSGYGIMVEAGAMDGECGSLQLQMYINWVWSRGFEKKKLGCFGVHTPLTASLPHLEGMLGPVHLPEHPSIHNCMQRKIFSPHRWKFLVSQETLFPPITGATDVNVQNCLRHWLTGMKDLTNIDIIVLNCHMIHTEVADISSWGTHGNRWQSGHMCWYKNHTCSCKLEWVTVEHTTALYCETWTCLPTELRMRTSCLLIAQMGHMEEHDCTVLPALQLDYSFLLAYRIWLGAQEYTKWH